MKDSQAPYYVERESIDIVATTLRGHDKQEGHQQDQGLTLSKTSTVAEPFQLEVIRFNCTQLQDHKAHQSEYQPFILSTCRDIHCHEETLPNGKWRSSRDST